MLRVMEENVTELCVMLLFRSLQQVGRRRVALRTSRAMSSSAEGVPEDEDEGQEEVGEHVPWWRRRQLQPREDWEAVRVDEVLEDMVGGAEELSRGWVRGRGWVSVERLLGHPLLGGVSFGTFERMAKAGGPTAPRYELVQDQAGWWIRRTGTNADPVWTLVPSLAAGTVAVHGTTWDAWGRIAQRGLSRMDSEYITFGKYAQGAMVAGMDRPCEVLVYVDIAAALNDGGLKFYRGPGDQYATPGNGLGIVGRKWITEVVRVSVAIRDARASPSHQSPSISLLQ
ncbi:hypothetical protein HMN09_01195700 [Mycena chlorophos]|uniref:Uncharacterized protein n=1 Tax=Mycena chlorophos TaxID=658473 RepID=A0A8H6VTA9_MYCCL|nr:hypothetical protein HMN09_01195700 [Mycena chlorophos]